jgi:hypothetical protein
MAFPTDLVSRLSEEQVPVRLTQFESLLREYRAEGLA